MEEIGSRVNNRCIQDSIDRLPDELLISIVSHLPVTEAGRTSILARRCLSHLETLMLHTPAVLKYEELPESLHLPRLKKLILDLCVHGHESLLCYTTLINAAPLLREIVLKLSLFEPSDQRTIHPAKGRQHHCLEVLQIEGFAGTRTDVELAQYVLENAVSLRKIVIDFRPPFASRHTGAVGIVQRAMAAVEQADVLETAQLPMAREGISLLKEKLPAGVELIVL